MAERIGKEYLRGRHYTHLFMSPVSRTRETMDLFARGAGDFPLVEPHIFLESNDVFSTDDAMRLWSGVCHEAEMIGKDMMRAALEQDTDRAYRISAEAAVEFKKWLDKLPDGAHVFVVYHSPSIELLIYGLFDVILPQLQFCEGILIAEDHETLSFKELRTVERL